MAYTTRKQWQALQDQFAGSQDGGGSLYNGPAPWQYPTDAAFRQAGYTDEWAAQNKQFQNAQGIANDPMLAWADANGYDFGSADGHGAILDKSGNPLAKYGLQNDNTFWTGALAAGALVGGAASGAFGGGTGAASATGGAGAMTAEQVALLAANGMTDAQIAAMATAAGDTAMASSLTGAGMGGGLLSSAAPAAEAATNYAPAMNAAQAESAVGTAGYGASSAGAGGGAGGFDWSNAGTGLLDYIKANPKVVGGLLGAVGGATGGGSSGAADAYTGPMPTISRGGWQPRAQAQMMALPTFGQSLKQTQGVPGSGLWRYGKG